MKILKFLFRFEFSLEKIKNKKLHSLCKTLLNKVRAEITITIKISYPYESFTKSDYVKMGKYMLIYTLVKNKLYVLRSQFKSAHKRATVVKILYKIRDPAPSNNPVMHHAPPLLSLQIMSQLFHISKASSSIMEDSLNVHFHAIQQFGPHIFNHSVM